MDVTEPENGFKALEGFGCIQSFCQFLWVPARHCFTEAWYSEIYKEATLHPQPFIQTHQDTPLTNL